MKNEDILPVANEYQRYKVSERVLATVTLSNHFFFLIYIQELKAIIKDMKA
jgi:hypothetical protein